MNGMKLSFELEFAFAFAFEELSRNDELEKF